MILNPRPNCAHCLNAIFPPHSILFTTLEHRTKVIKVENTNKKSIIAYCTLAFTGTSVCFRVFSFFADVLENDDSLFSGVFGLKYCFRFLGLSFRLERVCFSLEILFRFILLKKVITNRNVNV